AGLRLERAIGDRALEAEAGLQLGRFQRMAGDPGSADTLFNAVVSAESAKLPELAVRAWAEWIYENSTQDVGYSTITGVYPKAEDALHRAGDDPLLTALLRNDQGVVVLELVLDDASEKLFREALALRESALGPDHPRVAEVLDNLGNVLASRASNAEDPALHQQLLEEALAVGQRGLQIRQRALGAANPAVAHSLHNVGATLEDLDRYDEAKDMLTRALALKEEVLGKDHVEVGTTLIELSQVEEDLGHLEDAAALSQRALDVWRKVDGHSIRYPLEKTAQRLVALGRFDEAIAAYEEVASIMKTPTAKAPWQRFAAEARIEAGDVKTALTTLQDLVAMEAESYS
ncbi:MAG TPA: tetratricopeptide repeat protein, partial [Planctomycetota bacterium]|nr:tetratricopeptide repeat protein [Planctomycetota bacterium]